MSAPDGAPPPSPEVPGTELPSGYLELYKLAVEMADRISARRGVANTYFLTINTGLAALLGAANLRWYVAVAGIVLCVAWWALLKSYRELNAAKFKVIVELERRLPVQVYEAEWAILRPPSPSPLSPPPSPPTSPPPPTSPSSSSLPHLRAAAASGRARLTTMLGAYRELGRIERTVPCVFASIYLLELARQAVS